MKHRTRGAISLAVAFALGSTAAFGVASTALDPAFSGDGVVRFDSGQGEYWAGVDVAADGRVYAVGETYTDRINSGLVSAYTDGGRPDSGFSGDGRARLNYYGETGLWDVHALPDGKVLVSGWARDHAMVILARYLHNGRLDRTFAGQGYVVRRVPDRVDLSVWSAVDTAGNIYLAATDWSNWDRWVSDAVLWKFDSTGKRVGEFGTQGRRQLDVARSDWVSGLAVDSQDRLVVLLTHYRPQQEMAPASITRFGVDGRFDRTFSGDGTMALRFPRRGGIFALNVNVMANDQVVVGSHSIGLKTTRFAVHKVQEGGILDPSYSGDGVAWMDAGRRVSMWQAAEAQADGSYMFAGGAIPTDRKWPRKLLVAGLTPEGLPDTGVGTGGVFIKDISDGWEVYTDLKVDAAGRLLIVGYDSPSALMVRLNLADDLTQPRTRDRLDTSGVVVDEVRERLQVRQ